MMGPRDGREIVIKNNTSLEDLRENVENILRREKIC